MPSFEDADPVGVILPWLQGHPDVVGGLGGVEHISGMKEAPWPHLQVVPGTGGDVGELVWQSTPEVRLVVFDDPAGTVGSFRCKQLLLLAARVLRQLPVDRVVGAGETVVTNIRPVGGANSFKATNGHLQWSLLLAVTVHPGT